MRRGLLSLDVVIAAMVIVLFTAVAFHNLGSAAAQTALARKELSEERRLIATSELLVKSCGGIAACDGVIARHNVADDWKLEAAVATGFLHATVSRATGPAGDGCINRIVAVSGEIEVITACA